MRPQTQRRKGRGRRRRRKGGRGEVLKKGRKEKRDGGIPG
jgi:hypothetical protein